MRIVSQDKSIGQILSSNFFRIPRFQRPYSWTEDNVKDFWGDLTNRSEADHFIGSMVVFKDGYCLGVVDGQQRLTTITIALAAIREQFKKIGKPELAQGLQQNIERKNIENNNEFVLQTETSYPFFQEKIQKDGEAAKFLQEGEEEKAIKKAYEVIEKILEDKLKEFRTTSIAGEDFEINSLSFLRECRDRTLGLKLIFIELDNEDDAYIIFETLNTRGKDLEVSDLAKNHFFKLLRKTNISVDIPRDYWKKIVKTVENSKYDVGLNDYILHYWLSKFSYTTKKGLFKDLKDKIVESNAQNEFNDLVTEADHYRTIFDPSFRKWSKEEFKSHAALEAILIFSVRQPYPALLSALALYSEKKLRLADLNRILTLIEKFHFISSAVVSQRSSGSISTAYSKFGRDLRKTKDASAVVKLIDSFQVALGKTLPERDEFIVNFNKLYFTEKVSRNKKVIQYILSKVDNHLRNNIPIDYDLMTIEHLLPQSSDNEENVGLIGNLVYVSRKTNEKLGTKNFIEKKKILEAEGHPLDKVIQISTIWKEGEIQERSNFLAELAYDVIWKF